MPHAYAEEQLLEQPAIELFTVFGWQVAWDWIRSACV